MASRAARVARHPRRTERRSRVVWLALLTVAVAAPAGFLAAGTISTTEHGARVSGPSSSKPPLGGLANVVANPDSPSPANPPTPRGPTDGPLASIPSATPSAARSELAASESPASPRPQPSPAGGAIRGKPAATVVQSVVQAWVDDQGQTRAQVLAEIANRSGTSFAIESSEYRVFDRRGREVARGIFGHAFPQVIEPGGRAYLVDSLPALFAPVADLARVDTSVLALTPSARDGVTTADLRVDAITWSTGPGGGLMANGLVRNLGVTNRRGIATAVVFLGPDDRLLALVYDLTDASSTPAGATAPFDTDYPTTAPISPRDVDRAVGIAMAPGH